MPQETIKRFFKFGFTAADVAEPLVSFDAERSARSVLALMRELQLPVAGIRKGGLVRGYVCASDLAAGRCGSRAAAIDDAVAVEADTPLHLVIAALSECDFVFVRTLGAVAGVVTRGDMEKPTSRMWLFGMVTVIEQAFGRLLEARHPNESWLDLLPPGRLAKARQLQQERLRRGMPLGLAACLQLADKAHILFQDSEIREQLGLASRAAAKLALGRVERLRNSLAHAHAIVEDNWETIARWSLQIENLLSLLDI